MGKSFSCWGFKLRRAGGSSRWGGQAEQKAGEVVLVSLFASKAEYDPSRSPSFFCCAAAQLCIHRHPPLACRRAKRCRSLKPFPFTTAAAAPSPRARRSPARLPACHPCNPARSLSCFLCPRSFWKAARRPLEAAARVSIAAPSLSLASVLPSYLLPLCPLSFSQLRRPTASVCAHHVPTDDDAITSSNLARLKSTPAFASLLKPLPSSTVVLSRLRLPRQRTWSSQSHRPCIIPSYRNHDAGMESNRASLEIPPGVRSRPVRLLSVVIVVLPASLGIAL